MIAVTAQKITSNLSDSELKERIAIIRRFKALLMDQRRRFQQYLDVLDKQKGVIVDGRAEDIISHVELEEKIVADIFMIQKSLDPIQSMFKSAWAGSVSDAVEIPQMSATVESLKVKAIELSRRNKEMLENRMIAVRNEMKSLRSNPYAANKSIYADPKTPILVDIQG
ncbi:MAG: hypothetical protein Ta2G_02830 [Termitinemataceae bacterium]|nr:MAG: hypothetical protein Ta2G_02830 [Termitinemataceae bacterium]